MNGSIGEVGMQLLTGLLPMRREEDKYTDTVIPVGRTPRQILW